MPDNVIGGENRLRDNLIWYTNLRFLIITLLMVVGITTVVVLVGWDVAATRSIIIGGIGLLMNAVVSWGSRQTGLSRSYYMTLGLIQVLTDIALVSYLLYAQSQIQSYFIILYTIPIFASGVMFGRTVTIAISGLISLSFGLLTVWNELNYRPFNLGANFQSVETTYDFVLPLVFFSAVFLILAIMAVRIATYISRAEADLAQEEIISLATHQLRVPVAAVKGYLSLLHQEIVEKLNEKQRSFLESAIEENNRELALINNLLKTALLDTGKLDLDFERLSVLSVIHRALADHLFYAKHKKVKVEILGHDVQIEANEQGLRIALGNFLDNALKFAPVGSKVTVTIKDEDSEASVCVSDTGSGMSRAEVKKLFQRFQRPSPSSKHVEGIGLGLYIAKILIEKHNGRVSVKSEPSKGSTFCAHLPKLRGTDELTVN